MFALFDEDVEPGDPEAMDVADPRFKKTYDTHRDGLAQWFRDAIRANAARDAKG